MYETHSRPHILFSGGKKPRPGLDIRLSSWSNGVCPRIVDGTQSPGIDGKTEMVRDVTDGVLALFLMSPREVLVIVVITAVIVYIAARKRRTK